LPGMADVRVTKTGYAIEYDYFPPHQLRHSLEVRRVAGLFFAGQINGTTGYEEAGAQGIVAGTNAALRVRGEAPMLLERDQGYIGVLIDDLVTRGVDEPYRLFTSRAEFRLLLRQDNAVRRLGPVARERGLLSAAQEGALERKLGAEDGLRVWFDETVVAPEAFGAALREVGEEPPRQPTRAAELVRRPAVRAAAILEAGGMRCEGVEEELTAVEVELKYEGYVGRERERAARLRSHAKFKLDNELPYLNLATLSREAREKLHVVRPATLAHAGRVPGVSPADLQNLVLEVRRLHRLAGQTSS